MRISLLLSFVAVTGLFAQTTDSLFLRVILPGSDTNRVFGPRHRIAASTLPTAKAFINGKEVKVYPTGAFVGMMTDMPVGDTPLRIVVRAANGDSLAKEFVFRRPEGMKSSPRDEIVIDEAVLRPGQDLWLTAGEPLTVRMKGTPGEEPLFDIDGVVSGVPMRELPPSQTGGIEGIYVGRYVPDDDDACGPTAVRFRIRKNFFSSVTAYSKGLVSIIRDSLPRVAEMTGKRPFLNAGLGSDRLGGAKLGFCSPGTRVVVTGKVGDQYRVRLGETMEAWLPEEYAKLLPPETPLPEALTSSISITGNDTADFVSLSISDKVPYLSEQQISPAALVVNIYNATSNTNWVTHQLTAKNIEHVKWTQVAAQQYQLTIMLRDQQHWGHDVQYVGGSLRIVLKRAPAVTDPASPLRGVKIAVDAGHGGDNNGALGSTGAKEKDVNFAVASLLNAALQAKGAVTTMVRDTDVNMSMTDRADKLFAFNPSILVSVHSNSTGEGSDAENIKGTGIYYRYTGFKPISDILYKKMLEVGFEPTGVTGSFNFSLNGPTQMVNVLVETAFMSNPEDEMKLIDPAYQKRIADKIADGVEEFVKLKAVK